MVMYSLAVSSKIAAYFDDHLLSCGLTYSGHPLACAAGVACVNYYKEANILDNVNKVGKVLGEILEELKEKHPCIGDVRYIGLFSSIELVKDRKTKEPLIPYGKDPEGTMGKIIGMLKAKKFMTYSHENMIFVISAVSYSSYRTGCPDTCSRSIYLQKSNEYDRYIGSACGKTDHEISAGCLS